MMKITATAATPYRAVLLLLVVDVEMTVVIAPLMVTVVVCPLAPVVTVTVVAGPDAVVVDTAVVVDVAVVVLVVVTVVTLVLGGGRFCRVRATTSPGVEPGHVDTASKLQVPTGTRRYSCPLTEAPIDTLTSIGAP